MYTVPGGPGDQHPESPAVTLTTGRAPAALRRLTPRDRRRIADRIAELDALAVLIRERPHATPRRWAA